MGKIWECRRTFIGIAAILCLTLLGVRNGLDVSMAITGIVAAIAGANSFQKTQEKRYEKQAQLDAINK